MLKKARTTAVATAVTLAAALSLTSAATLPDDEASIVHVLNRVTFGARASDVDAVRQMGLQRYIEEQLHPEQIPDTAMQARLAHLETIDLSSADISRRFEQPMLEARREQRQAAASRPSRTRRASRPCARDAQQQANGVLVELSEQKLLRAIYSERQLQEVLTDFWFNHFNVDARKGRDRFLLTEYEREAIRPHVLGRFRDLLGATAEESGDALLSRQLAERRSDGPHPARGRAASRRAARVAVRACPASGMPQGRAAHRTSHMPHSRAAGRRGLNENYARELMELHTLGVDGGYTQKDVTEVARAFTGWTIDNPRQGGGVPLRRRAFTTPARRSSSAIASQPAAAGATASRCSTSWRRIRRRPGSSRRSWRGDSSATRRRRRSSIGSRRGSPRRRATCAR